jgi:hypothetical protein
MYINWCSCIISNLNWSDKKKGKSTSDAVTYMVDTRVQRARLKGRPAGQLQKRQLIRAAKTSVKELEIWC